MSNLNKAIQIALDAHKDQVDKGGQPYILHPLRLMLQMPTEKLQIIAVLHDVLEDSKYTVSDLKNNGFSSNIIIALQALTKKTGEDYFDFILRVNKNVLARQVKKADICDNLNLKRIKNPSKKDLERVKKYKKALKFLK